MLSKPIDEIVFEDGKVVGVKSDGEVSLTRPGPVSVPLTRGRCPHRSLDANS